MKTTINKKPVSKKNTNLKMIRYAAGAGALLGAGYLAYTYFQNKAANNRGIAQQNSPTNQSTTTNNSTPSTFVPQIVQQNSGQFPLQIGKRGTVVAMLQKALLAKGGTAAAIIKSTSVKGATVDGIFGSGTQRALLAAGLPVVISQELFSSIIGVNNKATSSSTLTNKSKAAQLVEAANGQNLFAVLSSLKTILNTKQYIAVSTYFKNIRINGIRVTSLVNALLSVAFKNNIPAKVKIRSEFTRMGLHQDSSGVWSIPNLGNLDTPEKLKKYISDQQRFALAITDKPTLLKTTDGSYLTPPLNPNTLVGYVEKSANGVTQIIAQNGERVFAPSANLRLL